MTDLIVNSALTDISSPSPQAYEVHMNLPPSVIHTVDMADFSVSSHDPNALPTVIELRSNVTATVYEDMGYSSFNQSVTAGLVEVAWRSGDLLADISVIDTLANVELEFYV